MTNPLQTDFPFTGGIRAALQAGNLYAYADGYVLSLGGGEPVTFRTLGAAACGLTASRIALARLELTLTEGSA